MKNNHVVLVILYCRTTAPAMNEHTWNFHFLNNDRMINFDFLVNEHIHPVKEQISFLFII